VTALVIGATVVALAGVLGALQVLARLAQRVPVEAHLRPLAAVDRAARSPHPPELVQLEGQIADMLQGDLAATARCVARLTSVGVVLGESPTPTDVVRALQQLPPPADRRRPG